MTLKVHLRDTILSTMGDMQALSMLELGNQTCDKEIRAKTGFHIAKEYWESLGVSHISVDVNGKNGALNKDLTDHNDFKEMHDSFDIIYNAGTTEHVEPYESQYDCFQILHLCCRENGVMFHQVPEVRNRDEKGVFRNHCRYYYSTEFFEMLCNQCKYEKIHISRRSTNVTAIYRKTKSSVFNLNKEKFLSHISVRNENQKFNNSDYNSQRNKK